jgi:hypothetical protein
VPPMAETLDFDKIKIKQTVLAKSTFELQQ